MADEAQPSVYTEEDIVGFLDYITDPDERAKKEAFLRGFGQVGATLNLMQARELTPSSTTNEVVSLIVEGVSDVTERFTG